MTVRLNLRPTRVKLIIPLILIGGAFISWPSLDLDSTHAGWLFYQLLWMPFSYFLQVWPLVCSDKPWFAPMWGSAFAAAVWSSVFYFAPVSGFKDSRHLLNLILRLRSG